MSGILQVVDWKKHFESAKSKTYSNKSSCGMPCKFGLGYKKLVKSKNGPAMFGSWVALIQILSRHSSRDGWVTENGMPDGVPYGLDDLELLSDIPSRIYKEMFGVVVGLGWVREVQQDDIAGILQGYCKDTAATSKGDDGSAAGPGNIPLTILYSNIQEREDSSRACARTREAGNPEAAADGPWADEWRLFRGVHPDCGKIDYETFMMKVRAITAGVEGVNVREAVEAFRLDCATVHSMVPMRELGKYLRFALRRREEEIKNGSGSGSYADGSRSFRPANVVKKKRVVKKEGGEG